MPTINDEEIRSIRNGFVEQYIYFKVYLREEKPRPGTEDFDLITTAIMEHKGMSLVMEHFLISRRRVERLERENENLRRRLEELRNIHTVG